jgi:glycosyltransferase involved in cell wall biosynthesis
MLRQYALEALMLSIVIPTWNNLDYLNLCIDSLKKHSSLEHELIVHVNDGRDGTLEWVRAQGVAHSHSSQNIGVCLSVNHLAGRAKHDWLLYANDDMVFCPGWDTALFAAVKAARTTLAVFSSTLIEPQDMGNENVIVRDFGRTPAEFDEARLMKECHSITSPDRSGHAAQPTLVHRMWWHMAGGYSLEFSPGLSSDDDLLVKFWLMGCRNFHIVGASKVYHFSQRSTQRVRRNRGGRTFVMKWGITQRQFKRDYLARSAEINAVMTATPAGMLKRLGYAFGAYPLGDLAAWDGAPGQHIIKGISDR